MTSDTRDSRRKALTSKSICIQCTIIPRVSPNFRHRPALPSCVALAALAPAPAPAPAPGGPLRPQHRPALALLPLLVPTWHERFISTLAPVTCLHHTCPSPRTLFDFHVCSAGPLKSECTLRSTFSIVSFLFRTPDHPRRVTPQPNELDRLPTTPSSSPPNCPMKGP